MESLDGPRAFVTLLTVDRGAESVLRHGGTCSAGVVDPRSVVIPADRASAAGRCAGPLIRKCRGAAGAEASQPTMGTV